MGGRLSFMKRMTVLGFVFLVWLVVRTGEAAKLPADDGYVLPVASDEIKIVSYNAENLFDTQDDVGKFDATFLPISSPSKKSECPTLKPGYREKCLNTDWTPDKLAVKVQNLKRALAAQGPLPDILALSEVENQAAVQLLATELGYKNLIVTEGPDERGIDVALLWRTDKVQLVAQKSLPVPRLTTRPVLKALFRIRSARAKRVGGELVVFVNHWPSQASPSADRITAARVVRREIDADTKALGEGYHAIVMGDFNSTETESPHPVRDVLMDARWKNAMKDVHELSDASSNPMNGTMPEGTYYFSGRWNRL
ncbi:MAG: endonuclease/exonuclease/phosphatase family protein, partial [Bdellovibrionaceae bacterium]|nr:endonuclease/exonuclease/phosphatase family protein [Pseudobdellovibrionaceae bacterium]